MDVRGPDGRSEHLLGEGGFAVTLGAPGESGAQVAGERSGRWWVAADGELLNARSLLSELTAWEEAPAEPSTPAIAAVIFAARGFQVGLERLAGDVAFLAWDAEEKVLWAARDRAGLRPLCWAIAPDGTILVASEPHSLLAWPGISADEDTDALREGLALGAPLPPRTPWRAVRALAPGELLRWGGQVETRRWWEEAANPAGADGARYRWARSAQFGAELAIQQRAAVDAPVAVALSGGVYSEALLVATAARRRDPVLALTLHAEGSELEPRAAAAAARARADHRVIPLLREEIPATLADVVAREPILSPEALGWWALSRAAWERGAQVLLTGVGGAALFGGPEIPTHERAAALPGIGALGRLALATRRTPWARRHLQRSDRDDVLGSVETLAASAPTPDPLGAALWLDRRLGAELAHAVCDRAGAGHGVRMSAPFADAPLARLVASIPIGHLVQVRRPRGLLLDALKERLAGDPPGHRPMALPVRAWLEDPRLTQDVPSLLADLLPPEESRRLLAEGAARRAWALVALAAWRRARA